MSYWGYYIPAKAWLGKVPTKENSPDISLTEDNFDLNQMSDIVYNQKLSCGIHVLAYCDGLFLFNFSGVTGFTNEQTPYESESFENIAHIRLERVEVFNAHVVCLRNSLSRMQKWGLPYQSITPHDLLSCSTIGESNKFIGFKSEHSSELHMARYEAGYNPRYPKLLDRRIVGRMFTIQTDTLIDSFSGLQSLLSFNSKLPLRLTSLFNLAMVSLQDHDYPRSLITSWTIVERLLDEKWEAYITAHRNHNIEDQQIVFINNDRYKKLSGRDYTVSVRTEILSLLGILSFDLYKKLENARKVRNGWMHELNDVRLSDATDAIQLTAELFESVYRFKLPRGLMLTL